MILIISGGRNHPKFGEKEHSFLDKIVEEYNVEKIITGECMMPDKDTGIWSISGADRWGKEYAALRAIDYKGYPVKPWEWKEYGKAAGPRRNRRMAQEADAVVLFSGGAGTQNMYNEAMGEALIIFDRR